MIIREGLRADLGPVSVLVERPHMSNSKVFTYTVYIGGEEQTAGKVGGTYDAMVAIGAGIQAVLNALEENEPWTQTLSEEDRHNVLMETTFVLPLPLTEKAPHE